jgi:anti-sigma-D factor RsdA-like protein
MPEHDDLDAIMRTDRYVDALASGARMSSVDPLSAMLGAWRDDVRSKPDDHLLSLEEASAALVAPMQKPQRPNRFGLAVVGGVAAAILCLGGFGAVIYDAGPGDALYGLRTMLFGESSTPRTDPVVLAAQIELAQVQRLVKQGDWDQAQQRLAKIAPTVDSVENTAAREELVQQYNTLTAQVIQRDPQATMPPPGEPLPVPPSGPLTFLTPAPIDAITTRVPPTTPTSPTTTTTTSEPTTTPTSTTPSTTLSATPSPTTTAPTTTPSTTVPPSSAPPSSAPPSGSQPVLH